MSISFGLEGYAALEAVAACDRLVVRLGDVIAQHEHAASVARADWVGPHRDGFEERFASVQRALEAARAWVVQVRHQAEQVATALVRATGPR